MSHPSNPNPPARPRRPARLNWLLGVLLALLGMELWYGLSRTAQPNAEPPTRAVPAPEPDFLDQTGGNRRAGAIAPPATVVPGSASATTRPQPTSPETPNRPGLEVAAPEPASALPALADNSSPATTSDPAPTVAPPEVSAPLRPTDRSSEPVRSNSADAAAQLTISRQTTLRLTPVQTYRADQLKQGDELRFAVSIQSTDQASPAGRPLVARAVVSEMQAIGPLNTRSYIFLKQLVLETGQGEPIRLRLVNDEPEIRFDTRQTNAVVRPLLVRSVQSFTVEP